MIIQVASFKLTGARVQDAPLHHHYDLRVWAEPKIIVVLIVSFMLALLALTT